MQDYYASGLQANHLVLVLAAQMFQGFLAYLVFRLTIKKAIHAFYVPFLIALLILLWPSFSAYNLGFLEWMPQLPMPYQMPLIFKDLPLLEKIGYLYYTYGSFLHGPLYFGCVIIFLHYFFRMTDFKTKDSQLLFIPFYNHFLIGKFLLMREPSNGQTLAITFFLLTSVLHYFYLLIGPCLLFFFNIDIYSWFFDWLYGSNPESVTWTYALLGDVLLHADITWMFLSGLFALPVYFMADKLKIENHPPKDEI